MSQHNYVIDDQTGLSFLADLNSNLSAIVSNNSGATEPATTYPYMWWADTTSGILKQRNAANDGWVSLLTLSTGEVVNRTFSSLAVTANSSGNVSRYVMATAAATAGYYANIATLSFPATDNVAANLTLLLTPKSASGMYQPVLLTVTALQATAGLSATSKISMLSNDGTALAYNDVFLDTATAANETEVDLWMQSIIAAAYDVQVLSSSLDTGVSITYNDGATWQAGAPSGAVTVTSSWPQQSTWTPVIVGSTAPGVGTYTQQVGYYTKINGWVFYNFRIDWTAHTGTGNMGLQGLPFPIASGTQAGFQVMHANITGTGQLMLYVTGNTPTNIGLWQGQLGSNYTTLTMDTAGSLIGAIYYRVEG
jgi:hypothetical protein